MTPRTRKSNQDANYKVYYSKKVPQQAYFPHKRKTVRRPLQAAQDGSDKRQLKFLPEKMKIKRVNTVQDSDEEDDEDLEEGGVPIVVKEEAEEQRVGGESANGRRKKRRSDVMDTDSEDEVEAANPTPKRRRKTAAPKSNRRSNQVKPEPEDDDITMPRSSARKLEEGRTIRRQSTMTQLVDGRRPMSDTEEPDFKPVKRTSRVSWGRQSSKAKDKKQRTLTQMVPGMRPLEITSDDDLEEGISDAEAEVRESQAYGDAIAARLLRAGLDKSKSHGLDEAKNDDPSGAHMQESERQESEVDSGVPALIVRSVEGEISDEEESYQPTQFIDAPSTRTKSSPRRTSSVKKQALQATQVDAKPGQSTRKSRFSLLSTPEKRRVRMIPSSQSPPDTPLSTQISPAKVHRSPLTERSGNDAPVVETPSKRKVTFQEPAREDLPPPSLKKFRSVIQDSEDEDEDDESLERHESHGDEAVGEHTQALIHNMDNGALYKDVGADTQAMLDRIDQACAALDEDRDVSHHSREPSEELDMTTIDQSQHESSPELGEYLDQDTIDNEEQESQERSPFRKPYVAIKMEQSYDSHVPQPFEQESAPGEDASILKAKDPASDSSELIAAPEQIPSSPPMIQQLIEDTCPSTPMVLIDSSDSEPEPTPPRQTTHSTSKPPTTALKHSADLEGSLVQVPQSPPTQHETQQSHTSKAEQQLHDEWSSYSQYIRTRPPQSSSMKVAHDKFSYHATPKPPRPATQTQQGHYTSQATTVDEVTPKKDRTQQFLSNHSTPRKIASSQSNISPSKPPPLFIPSSFPSPSKVRVEEWSSPVYGSTQLTFGGMGSLEEFSIPLPPPVEEEEDEEWA